MFESVKAAPPDPILGLSEAFALDERPGKINLAVGVYKDASGKTPVLKSVLEAERRLLEETTTKAYKPIDGDPAYGTVVRELLFGKGAPPVAGGTAATCHTPGGTGALRLAADYLAHVQGAPTVWLSSPTWANHPKIFSAAGLQVRQYGYFDAEHSSLDFGTMARDLATIGAGDVVLLHGCCHNPTGVDPNPEQWRQIGQILSEKQALPLVDFAYQGLGDGLEEDAAGLRALLGEVDEALICSSFSKNFGLYNERTGALTVKGREATSVSAVLSQLKIAARTNYSNPPAHGAAIVTSIWNDEELRARWESELGAMRDRINGMRKLFVKTLADKGAKKDYGFIERQRGMFSFSGLDKAQVERLRAEYGIYIVGSGRINVAGMTEQNMGPLCEAIVAVTS